MEKKKGGKGKTESGEWRVDNNDGGRQMKVLVTGGAGFIGSHTVDLLLEGGYDVRILDGLLPPVHADGRIPDYVPPNDVEFIPGGVRGRAAWQQAMEGVESISHLSAYQDYSPTSPPFPHQHRLYCPALRAHRGVVAPLASVLRLLRS